MNFDFGHATLVNINRSKASLHCFEILPLTNIKRALFPSDQILHSMYKIRLIEIFFLNQSFNHVLLVLEQLEEIPYKQV